KMLTIQAQAILLAELGTDMDATCLNGDIYLVGEYATAADRDSTIKELEGLKGVNSVKGVIKQRPTSLVALVEPAIADSHAETVIETGLFKELHIRSANVDVEVVQGEAVVMGVVKNGEEAADVVRLVEQLRPTSKTPVKVTSLLVFQESFAAHQPQMNDRFILRTGQSVQAPTPQKAVVIVHKPAITSLAAYMPRERSIWQKARLDMKWRILSLSKVEADPTTRRELITLSTKVLKDTHLSIEDRLVKTL
ncbi:MAG: BON domain-containing protein, partial [Planctomycetes bacterium]|nr:BON domain-containing protein [Planctomycetota bacterium]